MQATQKNLRIPKIIPTLTEKHKKNILAKCPNTVWVSGGEELAEVSDIEVS